MAKLYALVLHRWYTPLQLVELMKWTMGEDAPNEVECLKMYSYCAL